MHVIAQELQGSRVVRRQSAGWHAARCFRLPVAYTTGPPGGAPPAPGRAHAPRAALAAPRLLLPAAPGRPPAGPPPVHVTTMSFDEINTRGMVHVVEPHLMASYAERVALPT